MINKYKIKNIPSDFKLMSEIYQRYYGQFKNHDKNSPDRETKIFVPIDIESIAKHFKTDNDIIFGRLHFHLERKYGYKNENGSITSFFSREAGKDKNAINFPLLASILAGMQEERNRQYTTFKISIIAIVISLFALLFNGINAWHNITNAPNSQTRSETSKNQRCCEMNTR